MRVFVLEAERVTRKSTGKEGKGVRLCVKLGFSLEESAVWFAEPLCSGCPEPFLLDVGFAASEELPEDEFLEASGEGFAEPGLSACAGVAETEPVDVAFLAGFFESSSLTSISPPTVPFLGIKL